jgi:predicted metal-dependent hydrolase
MRFPKAGEVLEQIGRRSRFMDRSGMLAQQSVDLLPVLHAKHDGTLTEFKSD